MAVIVTCSEIFTNTEFTNTIDLAPESSDDHTFIYIYSADLDHTYHLFQALSNMATF